MASQERSKRFLLSFSVLQSSPKRSLHEYCGDAAESVLKLWWIRSRSQIPSRRCRWRLYGLLSAQQLPSRRRCWRHHRLLVGIWPLLSGQSCGDAGSDRNGEFALSPLFSDCVTLAPALSYTAPSPPLACADPQSLLGLLNPLLRHNCLVCLASQASELHLATLLQLPHPPPHNRFSSLPRHQFAARSSPPPPQEWRPGPSPATNTSTPPDTVNAASSATPARYLTVHLPLASFLMAVLAWATTWVTPVSEWASALACKQAATTPGSVLTSPNTPTPATGLAIPTTTTPQRTTTSTT
jgi:hypothetical protein